MPVSSPPRARADSTDRRDAILATAAELFASKGVGATTVREIADAVGVLSGSLYHYFESKDAIVEEILRGYLDAIRARYQEVLAAGGDPISCLHDLVLASLQVAQEHPDAVAVYQSELHHLRAQPRFARIHEAATEVQRTWLQVIEAGVADGSLRADVPPAVFYRLMRDAVWLTARWHRPGGGDTPEQLAGDITSVFLRGYAARGRRRR